MSNVYATRFVGHVHSLQGVSVAARKICPDVNARESVQRFWELDESLHLSVVLDTNVFERRLELQPTLTERELHLALCCAFAFAKEVVSVSISATTVSECGLHLVLCCVVVLL
jgi:hypothetical protein